jgi:hypothetical protein
MLTAAGRRWLDRWARKHGYVVDMDLALEPGGWLALTDDQGVELDRTRVPWTGNHGDYSWVADRAMEVSGLLRGLPDGRRLLIPLSVAQRRLTAGYRLQLDAPIFVVDDWP